MYDPLAIRIENALDPIFKHGGLDYDSTWGLLPLGHLLGTVKVVDCVPIEVDRDTEDTWPPERRIATPCWDASGSGWANGILLIGGDQEPERLENQRPYGDYSDGRFAWIFEDAKRTDEMCPACEGQGYWVIGEAPTPVTLRPWKSCPTCEGKGTCDPVPVRGRQRIWRWTP